MISTETIKELRQKTGISIMQCKKALEEAKGDMEKAEIILRKRSKEVAEKKAERALGAGVVASYIHGNGNIGSMIELLCETDFVAKNEDFRKLAKDLAMQVAATGAEYLSVENIDDETRAKVREILSEEVEGMALEPSKSEEMRDKILEGKMAAYFKDRVLLEQAYIKNPDVTIEEMIKEATQKFGERVEVGRFIKYQI